MTANLNRLDAAAWKGMVWKHAESLQLVQGPGAITLGEQLSPERVRRILRRDLEAIRGAGSGGGGGRGCIVDITLKDVETVERDPTRAREWVRIARGVLEEISAINLELLARRELG